MKICTKCNSSKELTQFRNRQSTCRSCESAWHAENYKRNKQTILGKNHKWKKANPERVAYLAREALFRRYGISRQQYETMYAEQQGKCAICQSSDPGRKTSKLFLIDHKKGAPKGKVRGLLCHTCNAAIGMLKEDPAIFTSAMAYLAKTA